MTAFQLIFVLALAIQGSFAKPKDTVAAPAVPDNAALEDLAKQAKDIADSVSDTIKKNLPDTEHVANVLKTQSQELANNVKGLVEKLQAQINENRGSVDEAINKASVKLSQTVTDLQNAAGPEAAKQAKELKEKVDENVKAAAKEIDELVKAVQPNLEAAGEQISKLTQNVLNEFVEGARKLQVKVNEAVATTPK